MEDYDSTLEAYADAQDGFARMLAEGYSALRGEGRKVNATRRELAGRYAIPLVQVKRLIAYGSQERRAQNGVLPEVYGEILRKVGGDQVGDLLDAAETGRWNVETAAAAVKAHRTAHPVAPEQVRSAWNQAETIAGGPVTADAIMGLPPADQYELAKPLRTVARFAGQAKQRKPKDDPNQTKLDGLEPTVPADVKPEDFEEPEA